jgi:hypothetical protein
MATEKVLTPREVANTTSKLVSSTLWELRQGVREKAPCALSSLVMWLHQRATDLSPVHPPEKWKWTNTIRCEDGQAPVAHACNPSYSGGRDQEDRGSRPPRKIVPRDPYSKKPFTKKGLVEWLKVVSEFKPQYCSKKKKRCENTHFQTPSL